MFQPQPKEVTTCALLSRLLVIHTSNEHRRRCYCSDLLPTTLQTEEYIAREIKMLEDCSVHPYVVDFMGYMKTTTRWQQRNADPPPLHTHAQNASSSPVTNVLRCRAILVAEGRRCFAVFFHFAICLPISLSPSLEAWTSRNALRQANFEKHKIPTFWFIDVCMYVWSSHFIDGEKMQ